MKVKLEIIDLKTEYDPSTKDASYLDSTIESICNRKTNKPNFLFTSYDSLITHKIINSFANFDKSYFSGLSNTSYGCNIMVMPSQYYSVKPDKEYAFVKSSLPNSNTITSNYINVVNFHTDFESHNNVIKVGILYHKGLNQLSNDWDYLMNDFIIPNNYHIYIIRRCSSVIYKVDEENCETDDDCPAGETCEMPSIPFVYIIFFYFYFIF